MKTLGIIPARYASTRFPAKALAMIGDKPMIQRVYEQVQKAKSIAEVIVATDDQRIFDAVQSFGGQVEMTAEHHQSGTDRCAEVANRHPEFDLVVNIQGDEPFINPKQIDQVVAPFGKSDQLQIATLAIAIQDEVALFNQNIVKVVFGADHHALYFSRCAIPFMRGVPQSEWLAKGAFYKHIGLYGFRRNTLLELTRLSPGTLERFESLEQLRWLENGYRIAVSLTEEETIGIDTPEDLEKALSYLNTNPDQ